MSTTHDDNAFEPDAFESDAFDRLLGEIGRIDDDALDAVVARAASDYNAPPAHPPAAAMWTHIAAARKPASHGLHVQRWQLLAASVVFVAFGTTIGRQWGAAAPHAGAAAHPVATAPHTPASAPPAAASSGATGGTEAPSSTSARVADAITMHAGTHPHTTRSAPYSSSHATPRTTGDASAAAPAMASRSDAAYRLATMRHFVAAEALLASYDGSAHDAKTDAQLASWAGELLSQTRLLLDSPAGRDPVRRRLLNDLELVLVQMAQLGPDAPKIEHDLIDGSVRHNDIITRLRTAAPAGAATAL